MAGLPEEDEAYNSASDADFNPDAPAPAYEAADTSDSEAEGVTNASQPEEKTKKRKTSAAVEGIDGEALDADFENSGDEGIIKRGQKKRRKGKLDADDEEGGDGGLIKTRAQRAKE